MQNEEQFFNNLIKCIEMTLSGNPTSIKQAEKTLESQHQTARFGVLLLKLLTQSSISDNVKLGASIYFKNYIKKYWGRDEEIISKSDQDFIKKSIVRVMLHCTNNSSTQRLISETITIISSYDFYCKWDELLPELITKLKTESLFSNIYGVLCIIESITCRYFNREKDLEMVKEIKYILELFQDIWLQMLTQWSQNIFKIFENNNNNNNDIKQIKNQILCIEQLILIFFDLNSVDLIEFFENKMQIWVKIFQILLSIRDNKFNILQTNNNDQTVPTCIDKLQTIIVKSLKLFNSKYEEEYSKYVPIFVSEICKLLSQISDSQRYDSLAAESIGYLSSVALQQWNVHLFNQENILSDIVNKILITNITLRESDLIMYEMEPMEWIRRDMEGSDLYTRRRGTIDLIRGLCEHFEQEITTIILAQIDSLMNKYKQNPSQFIHKDTAINLILAIAIKGSTKLLGATKINKHVPLIPFFTNHILPELMNNNAQNNNAQNSIILSNCIKFIITFRSKWPKDNFLQLLPMATGFLKNEEYVTHTYAAIAIDKILSMKDENEQKNTSQNNNNNYKYPKNLLLNGQLKNILMSLFNVLNSNNNDRNEYIMKCILRVINRAENGVSEQQIIEPIISECNKILLTVAKNPQKPIFNHYMFEVIAALINYSMTNNISKIESKLMGPFMKILEMEQASELHPYIYQIIGQMLRIRNKIDENYSQLFDKLIQTQLWNNDGNIIAISATLCEYLRIDCDFINDQKLQGLLGIYQYLLAKRTQDYYAFLLLSGIFQYIPMMKYNEKYLKDIIELICRRIRSKKSTALCCRFIITLSIFIIKNGLNEILSSCNKIQNNIFEMILQKIWLQYARNVNDLLDRKILTIGMIKLLNDNCFKQNQNLFKYFPQIINIIVQIFEAGPLITNEFKTSQFYLNKLEDVGAGNKFVLLSFAKSPKHDITKNFGDPRLLLIQTIQNLLQTQQQKEIFSKESKPIICKTINQYAKQFNINFVLPVFQQ